LDKKRNNAFLLLEAEEFEAAWHLFSDLLGGSNHDMELLVGLMISDLGRYDSSAGREFYGYYKGLLENSLEPEFAFIELLDEIEGRRGYSSLSEAHEGITLNELEQLVDCSKSKEDLFERIIFSGRIVIKGHDELHRFIELLSSKALLEDVVAFLENNWEYLLDDPEMIYLYSKIRRAYENRI